MIQKKKLLILVILRTILQDAFKSLIFYNVFISFIAILHLIPQETIKYFF